MKQAIAIAAIAAVTVDAYSNFAKKRVQGTRKHLERVYGKGLTGLFTDEGKMTHKAWRQSRNRPAYNSQPIYGLGTIDADAANSWFYGLSKGFQYQGMSAGAKDTVEDAMQSDCFYAMYGMVDTVDLLMYDVKNIMPSGEAKLNWFNVSFYDPLHVTGDFMVNYQYCGGTAQLNNAVSLASADYAFASQFVSN